ncbi:hypothetical protein BXZ70DRAFT_906220 [Cristinia sonorae]|uniref:Uncharacterized protein n=1 Tax=Cristinia sonorae TaxID=1940300 RepID=A0A8K0US97_9AGAR|nr:hypothetical protein BXZ70DRAFT_906220 [Cristinia sonorae]
MTINFLLSFPLLALVVTARPLQNGPQLDVAVALQDVVQAVFYSRTRPSSECIDCGLKDIGVRPTSSEEPVAALSDLHVAPIELDSVLIEEEKQLHDPRPDAPLDDLEGGVISISEDTIGPEAAVSAEEISIQSFYPDIMSPRQVVTLTLSCIAAILAMGCIGIGLYALHYFRKKSGLEAAWEMIPRVETRDAVELVVDEDFACQFKEHAKKLKHSHTYPPTSQGSESEEASAQSNLIIIDADSDCESDDEDFEDAEDRVFTPADVIGRAKTPVPAFEYADPDYLPLPTFRVSTPCSPTPYSTPPPTPPRSPFRRLAEMREVSTALRPASPISKPAWSLRASDAPALGFSGSEARAAPEPLPLPLPPRPPAPAPRPFQESLQIPGTLPMSTENHDVMVERPRARRAYRSPVPELDIAFALQLRPGLGLGADPAWIVRFLMAMFGWMTVLIGSGPSVVQVRREPRRAIA